MPDDATTGLLDALRGLPVICAIADLKVAVGLNGELAPLLAAAAAEGLVEVGWEHVALSPLGAARMGVILDAGSSRWVPAGWGNSPPDRHHPGPPLESEIGSAAAPFSLDKVADEDALDPALWAEAVEEAIFGNSEDDPALNPQLSADFRPATRGPWKDHRAPDRVVTAAFLFMGCGEWTPAREDKAVGDPDAAAGLCSLCGGHGGLIGRQSWLVCARCMRSGFDHRPHSQPAKGLVDDAALPVASEPGYVSRNGVTVPEKYSRLMMG